jgi:phytoene dehydrogenase-like protein
VLARIAAGRLPESFRRKLNSYRYGPGAFKMDWALSEPIPWRAKECAQAATVHVGGTAEEILAWERAAVQGKALGGRAADKPFVLLAQPTLFDSTRAPQGKHTVWAYCHVPHGSSHDMSAAIESQIERFAPGFRELILARHVSSPAALEHANANLVGGDVTGGVSDIMQILFRPTRRRYATPDPGVYLCSSSTPPGAGVHGMCGYHAAQAALRRLG